MKIESIRLKNYKVFRDVHLKDIPSFLVVVGANGSGKSSLYWTLYTFLQSAQKSRGIKADRPRNLQKLDDIEPPFAPFVFGDVGLRFSEPFGYFSLIEPGFAARLDQ